MCLVLERGTFRNEVEREGETTLFVPEFGRGAKWARSPRRKGSSEK